MSSKGDSDASDGGYPIAYRAALWFFRFMTSVFFREAVSRGTENIPTKETAVIFAAAPHANQFIDAMLLMQFCRRKVSFLIAKKSTKRKVVGFLSRLTGCFPVERSCDVTRICSGFLTSWALQDGQSSLYTIYGNSHTDFIRELSIGDSVLVDGKLIGTIIEILDRHQCTLRAKIPTAEFFKHQLESPKGFLATPKIDLSGMFQDTSNCLLKGGTVGIFPEGGSHDRPELLPFKPGLALIALRAVEAMPSLASNLVIIPVGINYFRPNKFRSRAMLEFGAPFKIDPQLIEEYESGRKEQAVDALTAIVRAKIENLTVTKGDHFGLVQLARSIYKATVVPTSRVSSFEYLEITRRLQRLFQNPTVEVSLYLKDLESYRVDCSRLFISESQLSYLERCRRSSLKDFVFTLFSFLAVSACFLPGYLFHGPVLLLIKGFSLLKAKESKRASSLKITANDVIATWKMLISLFLIPLFHLICLATVYPLLFPERSSLLVLAVVLFFSLVSIRLGSRFFCLLGVLRIRVTQFLFSQRLEKLLLQRKSLVVDTLKIFRTHAISNSQTKEE